MESRPPGPRITAALVLLLLFCLPLHFHSLNENRQISQECSCYLGGQVQLASAASAAVLSLFVPTVFLTPSATIQAPVSSEILSDFARAPPLALL
jgi:hypothetical protein